MKDNAVYLYNVSQFTKHFYIYGVTRSKQLFHALGRYLNSLVREKKLRWTAKYLGINPRENFPLVLKEKIQSYKYKTFNSEKLQ